MQIHSHVGFQQAIHRDVLKDDGLHRLIRGRDGWFLYNRHDTFIGRALERYGEYSFFEGHLLAQFLRAGDVVIEVGANIGSLTVGLAKSVGETGRVIAFEPQRVVFQTLCANVALNSLTWVETLPFAVGADSGFAVVTEPDYSQPGNFGGVEVQQGGIGFSVPSVRLDDIFNGTRLRLLKVDVEGMEQQVIGGASRVISQLRPIMYVENDRLDKSRGLIEAVQSFGYECYWHLPYLYNPDNWFGDVENLFPSTVSVNMLCIPLETAANVTGLQPVDDPNSHPLRHSP